MAENILYYGDNLDILRRHVKDESVDLIYLDPPFKSEQDYNILFAEQNGSRAAAQIKAFEDTWQWDKASAAAYQEIVETGPPRVSQVMRAETASAGFYESPWGKHATLQILAIGELLKAQAIDYPDIPGVNLTFKRAPTAKSKKVEHLKFGCREDRLE